MAAEIIHTIRNIPITSRMLYQWNSIIWLVAILPCNPEGEKEAVARKAADQASLGC